MQQKRPQQETKPKAQKSQYMPHLSIGLGHESQQKAPHCSVRASCVSTLSTGVCSSLLSSWIVQRVPHHEHVPQQHTSAMRHMSAFLESTVTQSVQGV